MKRKKIIDQLIYGLMTLLILINSLTPLTVFAEEKPAIKLENVSEGQNANQLNVQLTLEEGQEDRRVQLSQPVIQQATTSESASSNEITTSSSETDKTENTEPDS